MKYRKKPVVIEAVLWDGTFEAWVKITLLGTRTVTREGTELKIETLEGVMTASLEGEKAGRENVITEDTSDGYHTFKELYDFRLLYNAHLFNEWAKQGMYDVHKSQRHADGELCFGRNDYFVVVATLPTGQISNHYPMSDWDLFMCEAVEMAKHTWDGHTSQDVAQRLREALSLPFDQQSEAFFEGVVKVLE